MITGSTNWRRLIRALSASFSLHLVAGCAGTAYISLGYPGRQDAATAYRRGDYATALRITQPLAEQGNPSAQYDLGVLYEKGRGVAKDEVEAATWYRKAADQGYEQAQRALRRLGVR